MQIQSLVQGKHLVISIVGDLDASSSIHLDNAIKEALEQNQHSIVIDCSKLEYVSSAGLGVFISYLSEFEEKKVYFALLNVQPTVIHIIELLGLDKIVSIIEQLP